MTIWRMRLACWTLKATNAHSEYVSHFFTNAPLCYFIGSSVMLNLLQGASYRVIQKHPYLGKIVSLFKRIVLYVDIITLEEHTDASVPLMANSFNTFCVTGVQASVMRSFGWPIFCTATWHNMAFKYPLN